MNVFCRGLGVLSFWLILGCDSFSVIDQFQLPNSGTTPGPSAPTLTLAAQTPTLQQNQTTVLVPSGGTPPYTYAVLVDTLAYNDGNFGSTTTSPAQYTAGTSIGALKVRVIDSAGASADAAVTVLPPAPTGLTVVYSGSPPKNNVTWAYSNTAYISGFTLWWSTTSGGGYTQLMPPPANTDVAYLDQGGSVAGRFYRLYAVSGSWQSLPVQGN